ncbi:MAG: hypothetical protein HOP08_07135 [Cyclobacteriaceae bacterium]|nr:hypothetical protein [Cyclobacteriaceae bacterium]
MKIKILVLLTIVALASCSAPKYSYNFGRPDYYAGKKSQKAIEVSPLIVDQESLVASISEQPVVLASNPAADVTALKKTYMQMSKSEKKALRTHLRNEIKSYVAKKDSEKSQHAGNAMDNDLKLAAIFGAVGLVGLIIGGSAFNIIGGISLLIGVVFFVKWLIRQ